MAYRNKKTNPGYEVPGREPQSGEGADTAQAAPDVEAPVDDSPFAASESRVEQLLFALRNERDEAEQRELAVAAQFRKLTYVMIALSLAVVGTNLVLLTREPKPAVVTVSMPTPAVPVLPPSPPPQPAPPVEVEKPVVTEPAVVVAPEPPPPRPRRVAAASPTKPPRPRIVHTVANPPVPEPPPVILEQKEEVVGVIERW